MLKEFPRFFEPAGWEFRVDGKILLYKHRPCQCKNSRCRSTRECYLVLFPGDPFANQEKDPSFYPSLCIINYGGNVKYKDLFRPFPLKDIGDINVEYLFSLRRKIDKIFGKRATETLVIPAWEKRNDPEDNV